MDENTKKMLAGQPYEAGTPELAAMMQKSHTLCAQYNLLSEDHDPKREAILQQLIPHHGDNCFFAGTDSF